MDRPTLAGILRTHGSTYRRGHTLSPTQARAWRAIVDCRTAALGGVRERCANCGAERHVWRSSRNRHCPQCQTRAKEGWRAARLRDVLTVPCAHWVLPHALNPLAMRHPRWLYGALFDSAAATLLELAANPRWLGAMGAFGRQPGGQSLQRAASFMLWAGTQILAVSLQQVVGEEDHRLVGQIGRGGGKPRGQIIRQADGIDPAGQHFCMTGRRAVAQRGAAPRRPPRPGPAR